jgi:hypothetical protein
MRNATQCGGEAQYTLSKMARQEHRFDDDELSEILRLAVRKQETSNDDLRKRLFDVADELGISHTAVAEAEKEYRQESMRKRELALYRKESLNAVKIHGGIFVIVNIAFFALNLMTMDKDGFWFQYVTLMWGIGLAIHAMVGLRKVDWDDEEFRKWRNKQDDIDD